MTWKWHEKSEDELIQCLEISLAHCQAPFGVMPCSGTKGTGFTTEEGEKTQPKTLKAALPENNHYGEPSAPRITRACCFFLRKRRWRGAAGVQSGPHNVLSAGVLAAGRVCG